MVAVVDDTHPVLLFYEIALAACFGFVDENGSLFEGHLVGTDGVVGVQIFMEVLLLVDGVADLVQAFHEKVDWIEFIQFFDEKGVFTHFQWLQLVEYGKNEATVLYVVPDVATVFVCVFLNLEIW